MASWAEPKRRPSRLSQSGKLLALLERGGWWTTAELLHEVPCIVHSRISEIRKYGWNIEHRTTGPGARGSEYRIALEEPSRSVTSGEARIPLCGEGSSSASVGREGVPSDPPPSEDPGGARSLSPSAAAATESEPVTPGSPAGVDGAGSTTSSAPVALELSYVNVSNMPMRLFDPVLLQEC